MVKARTVSLAAGLILVGLLSGCAFFGGEEIDYTHWEPALSPDGSALAYESPTEDGLELFLRDLDTGETRRLTHDEYPNWSPTWAPAGDRVAFASSRNDNVDIYVVSVEDSSVVRLTTHEDDDINPDWGVDGLVYFNSNRSGAWEVYSIDPIEGSLRKITQVVEPDGG